MVFYLLIERKHNSDRAIRKCQEAHSEKYVIETITLKYLF